MVFISAPESATWVTLAKPRVRLKHLPAAVGFEHGFGGLEGIFLRDVDREMNVTSAKAKVAEFKPESFKISKRLGAGVDMRLFFKTVEVAFGFKHHGHPVISCVNRWLFIASATYITHTKFFSCRTLRGQANACRVRQKRDMV